MLLLAAGFAQAKIPEGWPFVDFNDAVRESKRLGKPTLVQHADTLGIAPRTFALDPGGRMLVAANHISLAARDGATVNTVPASLAVLPSNCSSRPAKRSSSGGRWSRGRESGSIEDE